ncbi:hypothetical protein AYO47_05735 [Planctomyces sp. SCGC AG-212-M04]|nr:hypothetical protein AYO47_05735 [Planctomyces sp. SCGC AG-212-M04]
MQADVRNAVRNRAALRCEYCGLYEGESPLLSHQVEHIIPRKHGGTDDLENLALACIACNLFKGANLSGIDPDTRLVTPLFHPRRERWNEHFRFDSLEIVGLTAVGRATIAVLRLNDAVHLRLRIAAQ